MKKILSWILLAAMLLGMFAGCGKSEDPTQPATTAPVETTEAPVGENNAAEVTAYLEAIYKDSGAKTAGNFERFGIVRIAGVPYEVVWTVDVSEDLVKIIVNDDGTVTIDVNEKCTEDTNYVLTATVTDANGNTSTASWEYLLPGIASLEEMQATVDEAYALENGESLADERVLTGVVKSIDSPWSEQYQNITVTILVEGREDKPIQCYRLKGEGAAELNPGDTITVQGLLKNYKGTIEFDQGCQLVIVEKTGTPVEIPSDPHDILNDVYALGDNESLPYGPVTLTGRICSIDTAYSEQYKNITVSILVDWYTIKCYRMTGEGVEDLEMNDIITVKGYIKKYNGTREFDKPELLDVVKVGAYAQPKDQVEVVKAAYNLDPGWTLPYSPVQLSGTVTKVNSGWSDEYKNCTVTFTVEGAEDMPIECYRMTFSDKLTEKTIKYIAKGDKITVKGILMKYQNTKTGATKVEFNYPELVYHVALAGPQPTKEVSVENGQYAIVSTNTGMAMTALDKNYGYPKGIEVSFNAFDELVCNDTTAIYTITKTTGNKFTIQDSNGKYLALKGTYASFNMYDQPQEAYEFVMMDDGKGNVYLKNAAKGVYLRYDTEYSSFGCYSWPEADVIKLVPEAEFGELTAPLLTRKPADGDVIAILNSKKAMTTTVSSNKLNPVNATVSNNILTVTNSIAQLEVSVDSNGYYTFINNGKYLTSGSTGNSLTFKSSPSNYSLWTVVSAGNNAWYIKNVNAKYNNKVQSIEFYKNQFTTYADSTGSAFKMSLYLIAEGVDKPENNDPTPDTELTIADAIALGNSKASGAYTSGKYYITGTVKNIASSQYGNITIEDENGKSILIYGVYSADGSALFDAMNPQPKVGDTIKAYGVIGRFNTTPQMKNGWVTITKAAEGGETPDTPDTSVYMTAAPKNGDKVVIVAPAYNKALSSVNVSATSYYQKGVDVTVSNGKLSGYSDTEVWTVVVNDDGSYSFENGGKNIAMAASFSSMKLGEVNDDWALTSLGNSLFNIKNAGRGNYMQWATKYTNWSTYTSSSAATDDQFQLAFYLVEGAKEPSVYMETAPATGDQVVIVAPAYNKALSSVNVSATSYYQKGVDVAVANGKLTGYGDTEIWTVTVNADGSYSFANGGKNIAMAASFSSMKLGEVNDDWALTSLGNNLFNIKNTGRGNYMQWATKYTNWSTYTSSSVATDNQYQLAFYLVSAGSGAVTPPVTPDPEPETPENNDPAADSELTIAQAVALGSSKEHNTYTTGKYYISGSIVEVQNTQFGNIVIEDENGDTILIYGSYDAADNGTTGFQDMNPQPKVGDTIKAYGKIGQYNGTAQMKNAWITITSGGTTEEPETPVTPAEPQLLAKFTFKAGTNSTWTDGDTTNTATKTYTVDSFTFTYTSGANIFLNGNDPKNNGFIKFGSSKKAGSMTFTVPDNVDSVVLYLAKYKSNTSKYTINGGSAVSLTKNGNDGQYEAVTIDTSTNKTVTLATASGGYRMVMSAVEYYGIPNA